MNCNVFGNKTSHFRQAFLAHVPPFLFSLGQPQLIELAVYCKSLSMLFKFICRLRNVFKNLKNWNVIITKLYYFLIVDD